MIASIGRSSRGHRAVLLENTPASVRTLVNVGYVQVPSRVDGTFLMALRVVGCAKMTVANAFLGVR